VPSRLVDPATLPTLSFDWGVIKPLLEGESPHVSLLHVVVLPGQGHQRHNHPDADEILYVLSGTGEQMVDDTQTFEVRAGDTVWIPKGAFHSTANSGWEPLSLLAIYAPAGAEQVLKTLPDYREIPAGEAARLRRV
jgi:oxalate decarboxylase/phosphoglucose isomerase-like protein (cupin superfamily)